MCPPPQLAINNEGGIMPLSMSARQQRPVSVIIVGDDDLFDDEELDSVLGGAAQHTQETHRTQAPQEEQLKMRLIDCQGQSAAVDRISFASNGPFQLNSNFMGHTVTPETSEREVHHSFARPPITIPETIPTNTKVGASIPLPEKKLEDIINNITPSCNLKRRESLKGNMDGTVDEGNEYEWCLIDFGDDSDTEWLSSGLGRKRQSFDDLIDVAEGSSVSTTGNKKSRSFDLSRG